ncbi:MAG: hypothetical protein QM786_12640 [Breznakibacter sp.]
MFRIFPYVRYAFRLVGYNLKVVFGNKFIYFFAASLIFYLLITLINLFSSDAVTLQGIYYQLMFPGLLLIFFPTVFGIQNDADARVLEIVFGIPNYRYKVYLLRLSIVLAIQLGYLYLLAGMSNFILVNIPIQTYAVRLMVPIAFFGMLGFAFSTVVRNGNGTVVVVVLLGLLFWVLSGFYNESKWNVFLNPFAQPTSMSEQVWASVVAQNRAILLSASMVLLLWGLLNLQRREKFMK